MITNYFQEMSIARIPKSTNTFINNNEIDDLLKIASDTDALYAYKPNSLEEESKIYIGGLKVIKHIIQQSSEYNTLMLKIERFNSFINKGILRYLSSLPIDEIIFSNIIYEEVSYRIDNIQSCLNNVYTLTKSVIEKINNYNDIKKETSLYLYHAILKPNGDLELKKSTYAYINNIEISLVIDYIYSLINKGNDVFRVNNKLNIVGIYSAPESKMYKKNCSDYIPTNNHTILESLLMTNNDDVTNSGLMHFYNGSNKIHFYRKLDLNTNSNTVFKFIISDNSKDKDSVYINFNIQDE